MTSNIGSVGIHFTEEDVNRALEWGDTASNIIKQRRLQAAHNEEMSAETEIEESYQTCLRKLLLSAMNGLMHSPDSAQGLVYWTKVWRYLWWTIPAGEKRDDQCDIGVEVARQFKNWKHEQLVKDLERQWLQMVFSYEKNSDIVSTENPHGAANLPLDEFDEMPAYKPDDKLLIWIRMK